MFSELLVITLSGEHLLVPQTHDLKIYTNSDAARENFYHDPRT